MHNYSIWQAKRTLANWVTRTVKPVDYAVISELLERRVLDNPPIPFHFDADEWVIGRYRYPDLVGFWYLQELVTHPDQKLLLGKRDAVTKAVRRALDELREVEIYNHFNTHIHTGRHCYYTGPGTFVPFACAVDEDDEECAQ